MMKTEPHTKRDVSPVDEQGLRHGMWIRYYVEKEKFMEWNYIHGVLHGSSKI